MKYFFMSDIHGSLSGLEAALACFEQEQADQLIILGDVLYHGPRNPLPEAYNPAAVAKLLNQYKDRITAVRGNCDSEVDQMLIEYPMMETYSMLVLNDRRMFLTHGHHYDPDTLPPLRAGDIFSFGHTHLPMAEKRGDLYLFNPGSVALPKENNPKSYGLFDGVTLMVKSLDGTLIRSHCV